MCASTCFSLVIIAIPSIFEMIIGKGAEIRRGGEEGLGLEVMETKIQEDKVLVFSRFILAARGYNSILFIINITG